MFRNDAQVGAPELGIIQQVIGSALRNDPAFLEQVAVIGDVECYRDVLLDRKYRRPAACTSRIARNVVPRCSG
jgi:hypothetical protein